MKAIIITSLILLNYLCISAQNQELDRLKKTKQDLMQIRDKISDSLKIIDVRINYLQSQIKPVENVKTEFSVTSTRSAAKIKNKPDVMADVIGTISADQMVKVFDYFNGYFLVEKDSLKGFTSEIYLYKNAFMIRLINDQDKNEIIKKYGQAISNRIFIHDIWIGMTSDMAILSIGRPTDINRTVGSWGVDEQWVYDKMYLYFSNGKLTSWQE